MNFTKDFKVDTLEQLDVLLKESKEGKVFKSGFEIMFNHPDLHIKSRYPMYGCLSSEKQHVHKLRLKGYFFLTLLETLSGEEHTCLHTTLEDLPNKVLIALERCYINDKVYELSLASWALSQLLSTFTQQFNEQLMEFYHCFSRNPEALSEQDFKKYVHKTMPQELFVNEVYNEQLYKDIAFHLPKFDEDHYIN